MNLQSRLVGFLESPNTRNTLIGLILLNAVVLGLETIPSVNDQRGYILATIDQILLYVFTFELVLKLCVYRLSFFKDHWNNFDAAVIAIALFPQAGAFSVLRALRILRVLRLIGMMPQLRLIVNGLFEAIPGIASAFVLLALLFYTFSVMASKLFGAAFPEWYGSLGRAAYSLFQVMTFDGWSNEMVRPMMKVHPYAWAFFIPFMLVISFMILNLFIGIIVDAMHNARAAEDLERKKKEKDFNPVETQLKEIETIRASIDALEQAIIKNKT